MTYKKRLIDNKINEYLQLFGAICVEGPKWCGKTSSCLNASKSVYFVGDPKNNFSNRKMAQLDPNIILNGDRPRLVDEWQEVPEIWDAVRFEVDKKGEEGMFLLTGSSTPKRKGILHSGAGRIAKLKMRTMSLYEMGISTGEVSLKELCDGKIETKISKNDITLEKIIDCIIMGGWPSNVWKLDNPNINIGKEYVKSIFDDKIYRFDGKNRNADKFLLLLRSLARNECTEVSESKIIADIRGVDKKNIEQETISSYIDILNRLFLIENVRPFDVNIRSTARIKQLEKKRFVDPSIACAILNVDKKYLLEDLNTLGYLFESMCIRDLFTYAEYNDYQLFHYQDYNENEVDVVLKMMGQDYVFIEIKLGSNQIEEASRKLIKIKNKIIDDGKVPPKEMIVIVGLGKEIYKREDGVFVVPINALKA